MWIYLVSEIGKIRVNGAFQSQYEQFKMHVVFLCQSEFPCFIVSTAQVD